MAGPHAWALFLRKPNVVKTYIFWEKKKRQVR